MLNLFKANAKRLFRVVLPVLPVIPITFEFENIPYKTLNKINKSKIIKKVKIINNFYKKIFYKNPNIAVLGLNPHNFLPTKQSEEREIISPAIKTIKKSGRVRYQLGFDARNFRRYTRIDSNEGDKYV